jgi:RNA polymerase sigma-54 factor
MQDNPSLSDEDRQFFAEKLSRAKELIKFLENRGNTLQKLGEFIVEKQKDFLDHGVKELHPLSMKEAAAALDLSESTISRAAAEKYVKTPWGVLPFKFFFTAGYVSEEGVAVSRTADMEYLKKLIDEEDKSKPLSDEKLSKLLNDAGHQVARRTVAKYREKMNIPSASLRKEFF